MATIGVGLGLPNYNPGAADRNLVGQAVKQSEQDAVEKTMLEDKIKATGMSFLKIQGSI
jgi:OTU domain-containing protein 5